MTDAATRLQARDDDWRTTATCHGEERLAKIPPRKSQIPYASAESRDRAMPPAQPRHRV
jgi:hypothetical protein